MQKLTLVLVGLVVILGIVSGTLWSQLRADRQLTSDLRAQMVQAETLYPEHEQLTWARLAARIQFQSESST